ncbi:MAG: GGDEF domain-containing protein [Deltaproteobacteria bacterium]|nr:MAG: GGDEF domain-containing protein [Deltaproteobacteria bacterium]
MVGTPNGDDRTLTEEQPTSTAEEGDELLRTQPGLAELASRRSPAGLERDTDRATVVAVQRFKERMDTGHECLVEIYGDNLGANHRLAPGRWVVGRSLECDIVVTAGSVSRQHAAFSVQNGAVWLEDLQSTNGTYVNDRPVKRLLLQSGDLVAIGSTIFKFLAGSNVEAAYHEEIYRMTIEDGLTQLFNKAYFHEALDREFRRSQRYHRPLSLVMLDIDHFKRVNDDYGHLVGDHVIKEVAGILRSRARSLETVARYGGEEFGLILPETEVTGAAILAEVLRGLVDEHPFEIDDGTLHVTVSLGVAEYDPEMKHPDELVALADSRLYLAKEGGRNRVVSG